MFEISPAEWTAILLSLRVAVIATLVATPFGIALAWLLARHEFWGKSVLDALVHLPLVLPPVVTGYLLLLTFGRRGLVGAWLADNLGIVFAFRWTGAALACGVMSFPLLVRPIRLSIEAIDRRLEQASSTLGAAPWQVFATVTLPLALPGVLAGMVLGFAKAIGEFGATITFVSNIPGETQTISSAIYSLIQTPDGDTAAARLVLISIVIAMGALIASEWFARRATQTPARELTMLRVDVTKQLGEFSLEAAFESQGRVTGLFGASGAGKTSLINMIAGLLRPDRGVIALDGETLDDTVEGHSCAAAPAADRLRVSGRAAVSASRRAAKSRLRPAHEQPRRGSRAARRASPTCSISAICSTAVPASSPAANASASRSAARCCRSRACCCWTSRWDRSTRAARSEILPYLVRLRDEGIPMVYVSHDAAELRQLATQIVMLKQRTRDRARRRQGADVDGGS